MQNYVRQIVRIKDKTVVVCALRRRDRVCLEAACAVPGCLPEPPTPGQGAQVVVLPGGAALVRSASYAIGPDRTADQARLAQALFDCCMAVICVEDETERRADPHGEKGSQ